MVELRRHARTPIDLSVEFVAKDGGRPAPGVGKDISLGGMFVETHAPAAFGSSVVVRMRLPGTKDDLILPGVVRWTRDDGMGVQFGLIGARETHAITELGKKY